MIGLCALLLAAAQSAGPAATTPPGLAAPPAPAGPTTTRSLSRGDVAFVVAAHALVRSAPRAEAARVAELASWTSVRIEKREARWALVTAGPRTLWFDHPAAEARPLAPTSPLAFGADAVRGWMPLEDLHEAPPPRPALLEAARGAASPEEGRVSLLRAWALDPFDADVARLVGPGARGPVRRRERSSFQRADLVFGCRGDLTRAQVVGGALMGLGGPRPPSMAEDVCVGHIDVRPPCDEAPDRQSEHKAALSRFLPRFGNHGPALRLVLAPGGSDRPLYVITRLLAADGCSGCDPAVATADVRVERLRVPAGALGPTVLYVSVPRYVGVLYDVVAADTLEDVDAEPVSFDLGEAFDQDPRDEPGPGEHLFMAPPACECRCDDD
jgi:hypothetical protein